MKELSKYLIYFIPFGLVFALPFVLGVTSLIIFANLDASLYDYILRDGLRSACLRGVFFVIFWLGQFCWWDECNRILK